MYIKSIQRKAEEKFGYRRKQLSFKVLIFISLAAVLKVSEMIITSFLITEKYITANDLFMPAFQPWQIIRTCFFLLENILWICGITSAVQWLTKTNCRTSSLLLLVSVIRIISFSALFPTVYSAFLSGRCILNSYTAEYSEGILTISFYLALISLFGIFFFMYVISGMFLSPFILVNESQKNVFMSIYRSFSLMKGNRIRFFGILVSFIPYGILSLLIFPAPFVFARLITWYGIFADDILENQTVQYDYN